MKKLMAIILAFCLFALVLPPAAVKAETIAKPTIDEILSEYHRKAFDSNFSNARSTTSNSGRSGNSSLEQETVDILTGAGYEAYAVHHLFEPDL